MTMGTDSSLPQIRQRREERREEVFSDFIGNGLLCFLTRHSQRYASILYSEAQKAGDFLKQVSTLNPRMSRKQFLTNLVKEQKKTGFKNYTICLLEPMDSLQTNLVLAGFSREIRESNSIF
jgi:hypothetical protein